MSIDARDRWRLILGAPPVADDARLRRLGTTLEELYGHGRGEGSREELLGPGGGRGRPELRARDWSAEIEALFGEEVYEEILGRAVEGGRAQLLLELEHEELSPSVELLEQILSLKGGLSEAHLARLRPLVQRIVEALVAELAVRIQPALTGVNMGRVTRRPGGALDLRRTVSANLGTVREFDGEPRLVPEKLYYQRRGRRSLDWRVVLVVDVSGSMEPSVIYSAMMAAILSAVPWVDVKFVAFSTEIVDLSQRVADPLGLLLEISVGGGTHIAKGLRYARSLMAVPSRTIVLLVSDFEEGFPVGGLLQEVRELVSAGAKPLGIAALSDAGKPRYNLAIAERVVQAGMPVAALTPLQLARWVGEELRRG